jgi:di/tripeptidase
MSQFGAICVDSLGPTGDFDHSDREYLSIDSIVPYTQFAYDLICDLAEDA